MTPWIRSTGGMLRAKGASVLLSCAALAPLACDQDPAALASASESTGRVILESELVLEEADSIFIGRPSGIAVSAAGQLAIGDGLERRVLVFDGNGKRRAIVGRKGAGPGEFATTSFIAFPSESSMVVSDLAQRRLSLFRLTDSVRFVRQVNVTGTANYIQARGESTVVLGLLDTERRTALASWRIGEDSLRAHLLAPRELLDGKMLPGSLPDAMVAFRENDYVVAFLGVDYAVRYATATDDAIDTIRIPAARRRGVPRDLDARLLALGMESHRLYDQVSLLQNVGALSGGRVALVHFDMTARGQRPFNGAAWVSVVEPDAGRACVDIPLPVRSESRARIAFRGDTLLVIDQRSDEQMKASTVVSRYTIVLDSCTWLPTDHRLATWRGGTPAPD